MLLHLLSVHYDLDDTPVYMSVSKSEFIAAPDVFRNPDLFSETTNFPNQVN